MLRIALVASLLACSSALQLFAAPRAPALAASRMPAAVRMQQPAEAETEAAAAPAAAVEGVVMPTGAFETVESAASLAHKERLLAANPALATSFKRATFWTNGTASVLEVINVLGRFEKCVEFRVRTQFAEVENSRAEDARQAETLKRYEMAGNMKCAERAALYMNIGDMPFTNAALAKSVGLTVEDFQQLEPSKLAANVVFDALAESAAGLIPYDTFDARRNALITEDGGFNELSFRTGLYKSRALIILAWFLFGKGNFVWVLVSVKFLHDWKPDLVPSPVDMGLFKIGTFI